MDYIILDLEWNGNISGRTKKYFNELIEIGAVRLNSELNVTDKFQTFIKPFHHRKITGRVKALTSLTSENLSGG